MWNVFHSLFPIGVKMKTSGRTCGEFTTHYGLLEKAQQHNLKEEKLNDNQFLKFTKHIPVMVCLNKRHTMHAEAMTFHKGPFRIFRNFDKKFQNNK